jgi:hypothetical protein
MQLFANIIYTFLCKGNGPNKCENANTFIICLKQNGMTTAAVSINIHFCFTFLSKIDYVLGTESLRNW